MKKTADGLRVVLSERNLRALLAKLRQGDSSRTICIPSAFGIFCVSGEPDDQHYADREPGVMHPETEQLMKDETD